jgi:hypothetical protein
MATRERRLEIWIKSQVPGWHRTATNGSKTCGDVGGGGKVTSAWCNEIVSESNYLNPSHIYSNGLRIILSITYFKNVLPAASVRILHVPFGLENTNTFRPVEFCAYTLPGAYYACLYDSKIPSGNFISRFFCDRRTNRFICSPRRTCIHGTM